jgi:hypothetical protein
MVFLLGNASNRITEKQDSMLAGIYSEDQRLDAEERMIEKLLQRIDVQHIRPILAHLDQQDHQVEEVEQRIPRHASGRPPGRSVEMAGVVALTSSW